MEEAVRKFGMRQLIYHDVLAKEVFPRGYSSAVAGLEAWSSQLTNGSGDDDRLVAWLFSVCEFWSCVDAILRYIFFLRRFLSDYTRAPPEMRHPLNYKDALAKHQACGGYLHFKALLQDKCPAKDWKTISDEVDEAFMQKFLDADLAQAMSTSVPPGDIQAISALRRA